MNIDRIAYEQLFPTGVYANQRFRAEATVVAGENLTECYQELAKQVEQAFVVMNPQIKWGETPTDLPVVNTTPQEVAIQSHIKTISECKTVNHLKIFEKLVNRANVPELTEAYNQRLKQLQ